MTSTQGPQTINQDQLRALSDRVTGDVLVPGADGFEDARHVAMRHLETTPGVIVRVTDTADVAAAIAFARDAGLELAVRSGGHSGAAHGTVEGGVVIDLRDLDGIDVDAPSRTAWVGTGATAGAYTTAVGEHGLVTGFGDTGSVGIGGITLGGGQGFLSRAHGLTIDNLLAVELVTADGRVVVADADEHPDLFWALRGGGGNFGVASRFQFRLRELPEVVGGLLMLPATVDTIAAVMDLALAAPDELSAIVNVMPAPPMPFVPAQLHGQLVILALLTYAGPAAEGEPVIAPFRAVAEPIADFVQAMPYSGMFGPEPDDYHPIAMARTGYARTFDRDDAQTVLDTLTRRLADDGVQMAVLQLRPCGGAIARVAPDATAYAHREHPIMFNVAAIVDAVDHLESQLSWIEALVARLADGTPGAYVNFVQDEGPDRIHDIYPPETFARLAQVKCAWDPDNVFRHNQNVPPAV